MPSKAILLGFFTFCAYLVNAKQLPNISSSFQVSTNEINGAGTEIVSPDGSYPTVVVQTIAWDVELRRSNMYAEGSLVKGAMQQIKRCDLHPDGWFTNAGGPNANKPETWSCTNTTISSRGELPWNCRYPNFWAVSDDATYEGVEKVNGILCDKWIYQLDDGTEDLYAFWVAEDEDIPIASGKIKSSNENGLFTIFFIDFEPGSPPLSAFEAKKGSSCPPSTPPSISVQDHITSLQELLVVIDSRNANQRKRSFKHQML